MAGILRISEAASLALHAMVILAENPATHISTRDIADRLKASEFHLSKIMQRLARAGFVASVRGPKGGFLLRTPADEISLLNVYEAIEGPFKTAECLLSDPICGHQKCVIGSLVASVNRQVFDCFNRTKIGDLPAGACRKSGTAQNDTSDDVSPPDRE